MAFHRWRRAFTGNEGLDTRITVYNAITSVCTSYQWGWDSVCELRPPMGQLFVPQLIYEHGEPWRDDDAGSGKCLTRPPELSGNTTSTVIWEQVRGMDERSKNLALLAILSHLQVIFLHAVKSYDMGFRLYFPSEGRCAADLYRP
jgi:hypothetical protein